MEETKAITEWKTYDTKVYSKKGLVDELVKKFKQDFDIPTYNRIYDLQIIQDNLDFKNVHRGKLIFKVEKPNRCECYLQFKKLNKEKGKGLNIKYKISKYNEF